jgi:putative membrane protein
VTAILIAQVMYRDHWHDGAWWPIGMIFMGLIWIAALGLVVWLIVRASNPTTPPAATPAPQPRAREILDERYARGEISTAEYKERVANLA